MTNCPTCRKIQSLARVTVACGATEPEARTAASLRADLLTKHPQGTCLGHVEGSSGIDLEVLLAKIRATNERLKAASEAWEATSEAFRRAREAERRRADRGRRIARFRDAYTASRDHALSVAINHPLTGRALNMKSDVIRMKFFRYDSQGKKRLLYQFTLDAQAYRCERGDPLWLAFIRMQLTSQWPIIGTRTIQAIIGTRTIRAIIEALREHVPHPERRRSRTSNS